MKGFLLGVIMTVVIIIGAVYIYFATGAAPVATSAEPMPFEERFAKMALRARIEKEMPRTVPIQADETNFVAGAQLFTEHCAVCHGLPGHSETPIAKGMFPKPPQLFEKEGVTDDPPGETYWKAANGIRLTGMPAFKGSLSDTQLWQVSLMLANADKLSPVVKGALSPPAGSTR